MNPNGFYIKEENGLHLRVGIRVSHMLCTNIGCKDRSLLFCHLDKFFETRSRLREALTRTEKVPIYGMSLQNYQEG